MSTIHSQFNTITSLTHIAQAFQLNQSISDDGESSTFEFKGTAGDRTKFNKDDKKKFAKEISAFANTYGGILCIHKGGDTSIEPFEPSEVDSLKTPLEGWLRDSLEPPLQGIESKVCEGIFLVYVPQSLTKPHRSALDRDYYYRHNTQSAPMAEVMISAMYRSQDYLATSLSVALYRENTSLSFRFFLENESMIAGTHPQVIIQIYSPQPGILEPSLQENPHIVRIGSARINPLFVHSPRIHSNCTVGTSEEFQKRILYPKDRFFETCCLPVEPGFGLTAVKGFIVRVDYLFLEIPRQVRYFLFGMDTTSSEQTTMGTLIATGSEQDAAEILLKYLNAVSADEVTSTSPSKAEPEGEGE